MEKTRKMFANRKNILTKYANRSIVYADRKIVDKRNAIVQQGGLNMPWIDSILLTIASIGAGVSIVVIYTCVKALVTKEYF